MLTAVDLEHFPARGRWRGAHRHYCAGTWERIQADPLAEADAARELDWCPAAPSASARCDARFVPPAAVQSG